nr:hypothetical protein [Allorhizobium sonneratiae]
MQACSVSDGLTPPLDVGTSGSISKPLTDADMQTAMRQNEAIAHRAPLPPEAIPGATAYSQPQTVYSAPPTQTASRTEAPEQLEREPQNSLEAQADALQNGYNPVASAPLEARASPGQPDEHPHRQPVADKGRAEPETSETRLASLDATAPKGETISFLPIIGAPASALTPLAEELGRDARQKGLTIITEKGKNAPHVLKGYFTAYPDGGRTHVVYVWDVLDPQGNRLHRIQGEEEVAEKASDPWQAVPAATMRNIANRTLAAYIGWRNGQSG